MAGGLLFNETLTLPANTYTIKVGKGGMGATTYNNGVNGSNGYDSSITINDVEYIASGGGGGGTRQSHPGYGMVGNAGGSGGGGSHSNPLGHPRQEELQHNYHIQDGNLMEILVVMGEMVQMMVNLIMRLEVVVVLDIREKMLYNLHKVIEHEPHIWWWRRWWCWKRLYTYFW